MGQALPMYRDSKQRPALVMCKPHNARNLQLHWPLAPALVLFSALVDCSCLVCQSMPTYQTADPAHPLFRHPSIVALRAIPGLVVAYRVRFLRRFPAHTIPF